MKENTWWIIGCLLLAFVLGGCQMQSSGTDIITKILNADNEGISYYLESEFDDSGEEKFTMKEWRFDDGRFRLEMYEDDVLQTTSVFDGEELVFADHVEKEILDLGDASEHSQSPRDQTIQMLEVMYDYYDIEAVDETKLLDRDVFVLELSSKNGDKDGMTIWVDKQNWIILKTAVGFAGDVTVIEPIRFEVNPEMNEQLFIIENREQLETVSLDDFAKPVDVSLEEASKLLREGLLVPDDSFTFDQGTKVMINEEKDDHQFEFSYANEEGKLIFSLTVSKDEEEMDVFKDEEKRSLRGTDVYILWNGFFKAVIWQESDFHYFFVVESSLTKEEALQIIESMKPYEGKGE